MRVRLDHARIFAAHPSATVQFFQTMLGATVVRDAVVAGARGIRLQIGRAFILIYDRPPRAAGGRDLHCGGPDVEAAVAIPGKPGRLQSKRLAELQPHHWRNAATHAGE